jgi:hypothetical protein
MIVFALTFAIVLLVAVSFISGIKIGRPKPKS